jgi:hypothetical protein
MKNRFAWLALALGITATACATDPCSRNSPCPNDTPPTQAERDQCRATLNAQSSSVCYSDALAYINCQLDNVVCGGDGMTDPALSDTRAQNNCSNQRANIVACCTRNPSATVCQ